MLYFYHFISHGVGQLIILPLWWYSQGLNKFINILADWQLAEWRNLGLLVWLKNLFTPMFHDYTIIGRGLSFFMRLIIILIRSISLVIRFAVKIMLLIIWLALPVVIVFGFVNLF